MFVGVFVPLPSCPAVVSDVQLKPSLSGFCASYSSLRFDAGIRTVPTIGMIANTFDRRTPKLWWFKEKSVLSVASCGIGKPMIWGGNQGYIIAGTTLILLEAVLIFTLARQWLKRKKAEAELVLLNERLRLALEAGRSVGWDWDIKSGRDRWFGDLETVFEIPPIIYCGQVEPFRCRVHSEDQQLVRKAIEDARENRGPYVAEFRVVRSDQSTRWLAARGRFYYADHGTPVRMVGIAVDITERRHAENLVHESEERFRLVANTAPVMIWMSGPDTLCTYFNQPWLDFTGRAFETELGNGWAQGVHPEDLQGCLKTYQEMFDQKKPFELQYRLRRHDGEYRWILDIGAPRFNPDGSFAGYIGSCIDITDRRRAEEVLSSMGGRLIEAHEEERTWIGRELHDDIVQRLALVAVELDHCIPLSASMRELHGNLCVARSSVEEIAVDIQRIARRLHSSKMEYLGLTAAAQSLCKELSEQHQVEINFVHSGLPPAISKEVSLCLFRVLQEALQNGIKHSSVRRFKAKLIGSSDEIQLSVSDTGAGFDLQEALNNGGVGLTSMQQRIRLLQGTFSITSAADHGTTIVARVPLKPIPPRLNPGPSKIRG